MARGQSTTKRAERAPTKAEKAKTTKKAEKEAIKKSFEKVVKKKAAKVRKVAKKAPAKKKKLGRPSDYRPEYCEIIKMKMAEGLSVQAFCGFIGFPKQTVYRWFEEHPAFRDAKKVGEDNARLFWDELIIDAATAGTPLPQAIVIFTYKNRFGWRDKIEIDQKIDVTGTIEFKAAELDDNSLDNEIERLTAPAFA